MEVEDIGWVVLGVGGVQCLVEVILFGGVLRRSRSSSSCCSSIWCGTMLSRMTDEGDRSH